MNINEYQTWVSQGASSRYDKLTSMLGLVGEVGEVADVIKKSCIYTDMSKFIEKYGMSVDEKIIDELGDVLWQYINLLNQYNLSIDVIIETNVQKLTNRHKGNTVRADGGER